MILCVCRGVPERDVVQAIRCGARTFEDVSARCAGAGASCGSCRFAIEEHIHSEATAPAS